MRFRSLPSLVLLVPLCLGLGCSRDATLTTPSGDQTGFALDYPAELAQVRADFDGREKIARRGIEGLKPIPASLKNTDFAKVRELVKRADTDGRSSYYADEALQSEAAARLLNEDRGAIGRRVAGAVAYEAKQKECAVEHAEHLGNAGAYALARASERQLEERRKDHSEALRYIEAQRHRLGRQNIDLLTRQAESITATSFLVFVRLELYRRELDELLGEQARVKSTLARSVEEDEAVLANSQLVKSQRDSVQQRLTKTKQAQAAFETEAPLAKQAADDIDKRLDTLQKDYKAALAELDKALAAKETPAAASAAAPAPAPPAAATPAPAAPAATSPASAKPALPNPP
jgi:hypothetical protein